MAHSARSLRNFVSGGDVISIVTPYPTDSLRGNSVSARRITRRIEESGHSAEAVSASEIIERTIPPSAMIALHARKSAAAIDWFLTHRSANAPLIIVLTGSDLYVDLPEGKTHAQTALRSMHEADFLVVSQQASVVDVPASVQKKVRVIRKSPPAPIPQRRAPCHSHTPFRICIASHLRPVKNPLLAAKAAAKLGDALSFQIDHFGAPESPELAAEATQASAASTNYHWHGGTSWEQVMENLATSHLALNTSSVEGGANALCEALALGVPVIASKIPANVGMLGQSSPGYFPSENADALANLLHRAITSPPFYATLKNHSAQQQPLFTPHAESAAWSSLLDERRAR